MVCLPFPHGWFMALFYPHYQRLVKCQIVEKSCFFDRPNRSCTWEHGFFLSTIHGPSTRTNPTNCGFRDLRSLPLSFVSAVRNRSVVASTHPKILIYYDLITNLFDYIYNLLIKHTIFSRLDATLFFQVDQGKFCNKKDIFQINQLTQCHILWWNRHISL